MHTGLVSGDGHGDVGGYSAHDVTDDPVYMLIIVMENPVPLLASAAGVVVVLTRSMMMMVIITMMMVTVTMLVMMMVLLLCMVMVMIMLVVVMVMLVIILMIVVMVMLVVMIMVMLVVMVTVQVPGEGLLAGPGCLGELSVLGHDGHQPLEAETGEAQQEARALSLGHALAHVGVTREYSCTWRGYQHSLCCQVEAKRFKNKAPMKFAP